jgi:hypothetical protein
MLAFDGGGCMQLSGLVYLDLIKLIGAHLQRGVWDSHCAHARLHFRVVCDPHAIQEARSVLLHLSTRNSRSPSDIIVSGIRYHDIALLSHIVLDSTSSRYCAPEPTWWGSTLPSVGHLSHRLPQLRQ